MFQKIHLFSMLWLASTALVLPNCQGQGIKDPGPAFYYWKTTLNFEAEDAELADQLGNQHIYLRYFDVDWSAGYASAVPTGVIEMSAAQGWDKKTVTPTVYITNRTFLQLKEQDIPALASKVARKITQLNEDLESSVFGYSYYEQMPENLPWEERSDIIDSLKREWNNKNLEIQIDCDWTLSTRDKYFGFLKALQENDPDHQISCTLRLHQYRDRKTMGIPPVERVILMCYNTGDPKKLEESDAILNANVVKQYLKGKKYPRQMDVALPLFNWGAWYRAGVFQGLLRDLGPADSSATSYLQKEHNNRYRVFKDTVIRQDYLREGDLIRMDGPSPAQMQETLKLLHDRLGRNIQRVAFFDWDKAKIKANEAQLKEGFNFLH